MIASNNDDQQLIDKVDTRYMYGTLLAICYSKKFTFHTNYFILSFSYQNEKIVTHQDEPHTSVSKGSSESEFHRISEAAKTVYLQRGEWHPEVAKRFTATDPTDLAKLFILIKSQSPARDSIKSLMKLHLQLSHHS
jgi:hypothetical protein